MHVGHLRSTVIGDAIVRTLEFAGHHVIRMNHLGDWGTQFGMLTQHMLDTNTQHLKDFEALGTLYREAKARFDEDPAFADSARRRVVALQAGDPATIALWQDLVDVSLAHINHLYAQLDVTLTDEDVTGESFYNDRLAGTVAALLEAGVAVESDGAVAVFSEQFKNPDGSPAVLIVRKSDGGYGYGATDLASIRYRIDDLHADRLIYITDARQSQHFQMVFAAAARAGWTGDRPPEHIWFGTMLGEDGKPFKTRSGGTIRLSDLLDEAVERARAVVDAKSPELPEDERAAIANAVGIGAVKYADLSTSRQRDLAVQLRPHARARRQHRALPALRVRARGVDRRAGGRDLDRGDRAGRAAGARAGGQALRVRRRPGRRRDVARAAPALQLPLRAGRRVHDVLRGVPGAQGAGRRDAPLAARAVRADRRHARDRARAARHHRAGAHVSSSTRAPSRRFSSSSRHARSTPPVTAKPGWRWSSTCSTSIATPA